VGSKYTTPAINIPGLKSASGLRHVQTYTRMAMSFYPHANDPFKPSRSTAPIHVLWDPKTSKASLLSFTWQKRLGTPSGQWSCTIKDNSPYQLDLDKGDLLPDDWVDISMIRNGVVIPVCRGSIDTIRENTQSRGGATYRAWTIAGRDHGKFFEHPIGYQSLWVQTLGEIVQGFMTERVQGSIGGNPSTLFKVLIDGTLTRGSKGTLYTLPPGMTMSSGATATSSWLRSYTSNYGIRLPTGQNAALNDILEINNSSLTRGAYYNEAQMWHQPSQNLYQALQTWCNPLFNELIFDLDYDSTYASTGKANAKVAATIRERPFVLADADMAEVDLNSGKYINAGISSAWFNLPTWDIPHWLVHNADLGISGMERFNLIELLADIGFAGAQGEQTIMAPPSWDIESIKKHGLRPLQESTNYVADGNKPQGAWAATRKLWQNILTHWHCLDPYLRNGTVSLKIGMPEVRVGQRLRLNPGKVEDREQMYVEGVDLNWIVGDQETPPGAHTNFAVTRGFIGSDRDLLSTTSRVAARYRSIT